MSPKVLAYTQAGEQAELTKLALPPVIITPREGNKNQYEEDEYARLLYNTRVAFYYTKKLLDLVHERDFLLLQCRSKSEKKKVLANINEKVKLFSNTCQGLTPTQGEIFMKLISRQTGMSVYDHAKKQLGSFAATVMYGAFKTIGLDMKAVYHAEEDYRLESIIKQLETQ